MMNADEQPTSAGRVITVRNRENQPVPGALVEVVANLRTIVQATTDQAGRAIVVIPPDAALSYVLAMKDDVGFDYFCFWWKNQARSDPYRLEPASTGPINLCLNGAFAVKVQVVDDVNRPMAGVNVKPWYFVKPKKGDKANLTSITSCARTTDATGVAEFRFMPPDCQGNVMFTALLPGYGTPTRCVWNPKSGSAQLKTTMTPLVAVEGTVVNSTGTPVADAVVHVGGRGLEPDRCRPKVTTDERGTFRTAVNPDQFCLFVAYKGREASPPQTRMIRKGGKFEPIQLVLKTATRVYGTITVGRANQPVPEDARLHFTLRDDSAHNQLPPVEKFPPRATGCRRIASEIHQRISSDKSGRFEFYAGPGKHIISWWTGVGRETEKEFQIDDEQEIELNLHTDEIWAEPPLLRGRVMRKDQPDVGIPEAIIAGKRKNREALREPEATTDSQGNFNIGLLSKSDFYLMAVAPNGMVGVVLATSSTGSVTIEVGSPAGIRGRILDAQGQPLINAALRYGIQFDGSYMCWTPGFDGETRTDAEGRFIAQDLVPGYQYWLMVATKVDESGRPIRLSLAGHARAERTGTRDLGDLKLAPVQ